MTTPRATVAGIAGLLGAALAASLLLTGCSGGGGGGDDDSGSTSSVAAADQAEPAAEGGADSGGSRQALSSTPAGPNRTAAQTQLTQALIKKGTVELRSDDVGRAQFEVNKIVDRYGGQVTADQTNTDDDGDPAYSRMVLRVPAADFDEAMADLEGTAELVASNTSTEDVTTKLIDTRTRLAAQRRSVARITELLDRAQSIRDIMAIEAQLSRRQADLESLERQAAYLAGQTTLSTITVSIDRTTHKTVVAADDHTGFVAGLKAGWSGLSAFAVGIATVVGALLPWLVVLALLGPPAFLVARRARRRISAGRSGRTPSAA